ncbi:MAG: hypothetical protein M0037_01470 [Betaproteobacteria bacterium]|nr:hypothetical protein [Betaproteobacteria bacterium]
MAAHFSDTPAAFVHPLQFVGWETACVLTSTSFAVLRKHLYRQVLSPSLEGFPSPAVQGGKVLWVLQDILDWLETKRTFRPPTTKIAVPVAESQPVPPARGRGRPRKMAGDK